MKAWNLVAVAALLVPLVTACTSAARDAAMRCTVSGQAFEPEPVVRPAGGPQRVLFIGDSMTADNPDLVADLPGVTAVNAGISGSGLLSDFTDQAGHGTTYPGWVPGEIRATGAQVVVLEFSGAYLGGPLASIYGTPQFFADWQAAAAQVNQEVLSAGATPLWVLTPPTGPTEQNWRSFDAGYESLGTATVSWNLPLTADGSGVWVSCLREHGVLKQVRIADNWHLTPEGNRRAAVWTDSVVRALP